MGRGPGHQRSRSRPACTQGTLSTSLPPNLCRKLPSAKPLRPGLWSLRLETEGSPTQCQLCVLRSSQTPGWALRYTRPDDVEDTDGPRSSKIWLADKNKRKKNHSLMNSTGFFRHIPRMNNTNTKLLTVGLLGKMGIEWKLSVLRFKGIHHTLIQS